MPFDNGRCTNTDEKRLSLRRRALSKKLVEQRKECQVPEVASRNAEQRLMCIVSSPYVYCVLVPILSPVQGFEQRNPAHLDIDGFKSLPSPLETVSHTDLPNNSDSANIASSGLSSETFNLDQHENRNCMAVPQSSSNNFLPTSLDSGNSYSMVGGNMSTDGSDFLVKDPLKVEKRVKRSSRKKGKKKGKQRKRTRSRKISNESDVQRDSSTISASGSSTDKKFSSYTDKAISEENLVRKRMPTTLLDRDCTEKEDDIEKNNEYADCSITLTSCTSYSDEMDDSELSSSNEIFVGEEFKHATITLQGNPSIGESPKTLPSTFADGIGDIHFEVNSNFDDVSLSPVENSGASSLADSFHDGWITDISANGSEDMDIMSTIKKESQLPNSLDGEAISCTKRIGASSRTSSTDSCHVITETSEENCVTNPYWSTDVLDACSVLERAECSSQASSSDDFRTVVYGKRDRRARKITDNESFSRANGSFVQAVDNRVRKDDKTSIFGSNDSIVSFDDKPSKASKTILRQQKGVNLQEKGRGSCQYLYSDETHRYQKESWQMVNTSHEPRAKQTFGSFLNNVKYKSSSAAKATKQPPSWSKSYDGMCRKNKTLENDMIHNEARQTSPNHIGKTASYLEIQVGSDSTQFSAEADGSSKSEQEQEMHIPASLDNKCTLAGNNTPPSSCCDLDQLPTGFSSSSQMLESDSSVFSGDVCEDILVQTSEINPSLKFEIATSLPGDNMQDSTGPVPKLNHVERTLVVQDDESSDSSRPADVDEIFSHTSDLNNATLPLSDPNKPSIFSSLDDAFQCSRPTSKDTDYSSVESVQLTNELRSFPDSTHVVKCQEPDEFETDLGKITQAVVDAYRLQVVAEVVQKIAGSPIADFEKFLNSASPVIGQIHSSMRSSVVCCQEQVIDPSLCSHWMPNFTLKNLWDWYEEPGCFGLEIKALRNYRSKRSSNQVTEFDAYFVPYLSAVQIFGNFKSVRCCKHSEETVKASEAQKGSLPQSRKEIGNFLSWLSSSAEDELTDQPVKSNVDGRKLLFEYFETDQPSWRRPLFEKIKDLVSGHTLSKSQLFGNPETLESLDLRDIHHASWYSVAWYPIYRIPEGNIRAAFLTYHSLGHIIHKSISYNTGSLENIICPVVGLQTYNDKGESWFQPRVPDSEVFKSEDTLYCKPSELIRERLRALKETASVMATAVISKGNKKSVNKHPDYNFFQSRS